jgi:hypothetical protein
MILIHQISNLDLEYINDIKEYLKCNMENPIIEKIVLFSNCKGFEDKIKIDSRKIKYFEVEINIFDMMKYGKNNTKDFVIYSTPFIKFNVDLKKVLTFDKENVFKEENCYYIFNKNMNIKNERSLEDILSGKKVDLKLNIQKNGYYISGFQYKSYDWRVSKIFDNKTKINKEIEIINTKQKVNKILTKEQVRNFLTSDKMKELEKNVFDNTNYNMNPLKRVGPKKLDVIIVSVNYNDFLLLSLENNVKIFENITVVTSSSDFFCQKICEKFGVNCIVTDIMYENGAIFNKGKGINEGIKSILNPDYILLLDADILVMENIDIDALDEKTLYTSDRYFIPDYTSYKEYISGSIKKEKFLLQKNPGWGFFQLFNYSKVIKFPELSPDASTSDIVFYDMFQNRNGINNEVLHLGEDSNWKGRKSKSFLEYKQFNFLLEKSQNLPVKTFKICTFYYNPKKDLRLKKNFLKFLTQFELYHDKILIGMVDYDGELDIPDYLKENVIVVKGDIKNPIWYKEILLNKMIDTIEEEYIIWIDCDLIYENLDWLKNINSVVRVKDFVQLFETINYLDENGSVLESHKSIISSGSNDIDRLLEEGYKPGGSWIGKTSILKDNKFFEKMYVGGGDTIFLYGLFNINNGFTLKKVGEGSKEIQNSAVEWINSFGKYKVGFLSENINHLYHGDLKDRNYNDRYKKLKKIELYLESSYDFCIIISTYNRPEMLKDLLDDIEYHSLNKRVLVTIFDDGSNKDYEYLDKYDIKYIKYVKNNGKFNYWKLISDTFKYCANIKSKYYIYLPDDIRLKDNFFEESVRIFEKIEDDNKICLNLLMDESRRGNPNWTGFKPIEYDDYYKTQWNDLCFISNIDFFQMLNFEILPINKNRWSENSELGSGVGQQMSMRLLALNQNMYHVINTLIIHDDHHSVMNHNNRKRIKLIAK